MAATHTRTGLAAGYTAAIAVVGITVVPLLFVVLGGFRTNAQINNDPAGLPAPWVLDNYASILGSWEFWRFLGNSATIALVATLLAIACGSAAGFALSRYRFKGREAVYTLFTLGLLVPVGLAALPLYPWLRQLGLLESTWGVALPQAAFSLPVTIVILRPFMRAIPQEIEDAATLDGATRLGFFWRVLLTRDTWLPKNGGDFNSFYYPLYQFAGEQIAAGRFPLWNPEVWGGVPFAANQQAGLFSPLNLLAFAFARPFGYD
uniref:carbohydrate ABC transporter permease n=1 Tax=Actinosynnema sp. TaxID=1872144 RepID=UPI003F848641